MSKNPVASNVSRRRFLAVAGTAAAASSLVTGGEVETVLAAPPPPMPVKYVVTIDVTGGSIGYTAAPSGDPHNLYVNKGDEITWKVTSTTPNPTHRARVLFLNTTPFVDSSGNPVKAFHWTEQDDGTGGAGGGIARTKGKHEYCVAVFDGVSQKLHLDDPKIIVGGGPSAIAEIMEAENELGQVTEKIEQVQKTLKNAVARLEKSQAK